MRASLNHVRRLCIHAFVPHAGNQYRPHALHPRRTLGYAISFAAMKGVLLALVTLLPLGIFAAPEAIAVREQELAALVNQVRAAADLPSLHADARLTRSATAKSADMVERQYFDHVNADGAGPEYFATEARYPYSVIGENLAMGFVAAATIVDAWQQSPAHARNLRDPLFADAGFGIVSGTYRGAPTLFIAQHLGRPKRSTPPTTPAPPADAAPAPTSGTVRAASVAWRPRGKATAVVATAQITGAVMNPAVTIRGTTIPLEPVAHTPEAYVGRAVLPDAPTKVFRVVVPPTLSLTTSAGDTVARPIPWEDPAILRPSFAEKYAQANALLPKTLGPIRTSTRILFGAGFVLFALAWLVNLMVEIRRQHLDLLVPGGALVIFLALLWMF
ncbi:CAP domain-containing protein [Candidatus Uhrbacteria bacterium]|nr:CAP domain-containing protein [Candidatus Uhrbacteria bacterium]